MTYERFSQLWTALVTDRVCKDENFYDSSYIPNPITTKALIDFVNNNNSGFEKAEKILKLKYK